VPYIGQGLTEGRRRVETFIATASQTTFNIIYDAGYVDVYQNGILLAEADYTATNGSQVVLAVGAALNDEITIIAHQLFSVTDTVSAVQGGTFTGAITASGGVVGNVTGTVSNISNHLLDEDNMASNDATKVPSQQSVKAYVDTEVSGLVDSAPSTLDTLNELAAALGDDANFSTTITNSIATKLPLAGGTLTGNLTMENTDAGSAAGPEFVLFRNSASAADADYLGQIKFDGKNDAGQSIVYAKITGKILDAADGTEDGIIEIAHKKAGSNNISARFRSDSLQLINGTNLTVAGTTELTGDLTVDTNTLHVDTSNNRVGIGTASPSRKLTVLGVNNTTNFEVTDAAGGNTFNIYNNTTSSAVAIGTSSGLMSFGFNGIDKVHFKSNGNVGIGTNSPSDKLTIQSSTGQLRLQGTTNTNKNISILYNESGDYGQINVDESGVNQKDLWVTGLNLKFGRSTSSESMRIKDDGRLLIGTDTSSVYYNSTSQYAGDVVVDMNIANNVTDLVLINSNNSFGSTVDFATNNSAGNPVRHGLMGAIPDSTTAGSESGHLIFSTKNTTDNNIVERLRIDNNGNVLANTTDVDLGFTNGDTGVVLRNDGVIQVARDETSVNNSVLYVNKLNGEGKLIALYKSGIQAGNIGIIATNNIFMSSVDDVGIGVGDDNLYPTNGVGNSTNGILDIGDNNAKFRNGYFNGTVNSWTGVYAKTGTSINLENAAGSGNSSIKNAGAGSNIDLTITTGSTDRMRVNNDGTINTFSNVLGGYHYYTNNSIIDTDYLANSGYVFEIAGKVNPNSGGSTYVDPFFGHIYIGHGWNGAALTAYIYYVALQPAARDVFPSGSGASGDALEVCFVSSGTEFTTIPVSGGSSYNIRVKALNFNSTYGSNFELHITRKA